MKTILKVRLINILIVSTIFLLLPQISFAINLKVPFTPQAPYGNWHQPWQDACEETSIAMVNNYYQNNFTKKLNVAKAKNDINEIIKIKEGKWGKSLDENTTKVIDLINNFLPWEAKAIINPSLEDLKNEIDNNRPIIIPAYGKALKNPYFKNGGPEYHMLVISGYDNDKNEFITQEPGTKYGLDFRYSFAIIMDAFHDYKPNGKTKDGEKIAIFTIGEITDSGKLDGDNDGLSKADEIIYASILWLRDSDGDGFTDGNEVNNGYSPTKKYIKL